MGKHGGGAGQEQGWGVKVKNPHVELEAVSGVGEKAVNYMCMGLSGSQTGDRARS